MVGMARFFSRSFRHFPVRTYWIFFIVLALLLKWGHLVNQDEGYTLTGAWQGAQGLVPYRDFFENITPGTLYVLAPVVWIFGPSYLAAKLFSIALLVFGGYGLVRIAGDLNLGFSRYAVPIVWLLLSDFYVLINHNTYALVFAIWALERMLWAARDATRYRGTVFAVAGLACAAAFWMHQARGGAMICAALCYLGVHFRRTFTPFVVGLVLGLLPFLMWPLPQLWDSLVVFSFWHYLPSRQIGMTLLLVIMVVYLVVYVALRRFRRLTAEEKLVWFTGVLLAGSNFSQGDWFHLLPTLFPLVLLYAFWQREVVRHNLIPLRTVAAYGAQLSVAVLAVVSLIFLAHRIASVGFPAFLQLRDPQLEHIVEYVQVNVRPEDAIFVAPYLPNFYFETQRMNPTRYRALHSGQHPPAFFEDARRSLKANPPSLVLLNYYITPEAFATFLVGNPVTDYVRQNYTYVATMNNIQVYRRVSDVIQPEE